MINEFDEDYFYSLPMEGREEILQNLMGLIDIDRHNEVGQQNLME